jgi:hypothetical protein
MANLLLREEVKLAAVPEAVAARKAARGRDPGPSGRFSENKENAAGVAAHG